MALAYSGSPLAECPHDLEVVGSNPVPATKNLQLVGLADELFSVHGLQVIRALQTRAKLQYSVWREGCGVSRCPQQAPCAIGHI